MSDTVKYDKLFAAVSAVMETVKNVRKTGHNKHFGYDYASDEDILSACQPAMVEQGLSLIPIEHTAHSDGPRLDLTARYLLTHTSGQCIEVSAIGCGIDKGDKAIYKALTGAQKYLLRHLFSIPVGGDDPDASSPPPPADDRPAPTGNITERQYKWAWRKLFDKAKDAFEMDDLDDHQKHVCFNLMDGYLDEIGVPRPEAGSGVKRISLVPEAKYDALTEKIAQSCAGDFLPVDQDEDIPF